MTLPVLGKEKIELDKDELLKAYIQLDQTFNQTFDSNLNYVALQIQRATGYKFIRTLQKVKPSK